MSTDKKIGIIAGGGKYPFLIAKEAMVKGYEVCVCAVAGECDPDISGIVKRLAWVKLGELGKLIKFFKSENVRDVFFAGNITKPSLFSGRVKPDFEMLKVAFRLKDRKDMTLLESVAHRLEEKGMRFVDPLPFMGDSLPGAGILTKRKPLGREREDIEFGWPVAKELARLDIGQTIVVKEKAVLAVESIEGTDETIRRGGRLGSGDVVVVKAARPRQDMRFDVPAVGINTIRVMKESGAKVLAFEAGKTIFIDKADVVQEADKAGITIIGR
ncbi:MAG: UDP-2,3-diacylglucosamine diphosphatase LpxI [Candidatus Omnitrophica bacterium]|nr:UDP-2,3-diacylglucosamine diphosphatase LpxI [Candidatus Omnitrophota bacterium]